MLGKLTAAVLLTGAVLVGLVAQTGSYLLAPPTPSVDRTGEHSDASFPARAGRHAVGVRALQGDDVPIPMTVWYPALDDSTRAVTTYSYAINMLGSDTVIALATYGGEARHGLAPDRAGGPYALVILSHGFAITASSYAWLAEHLASWGFVVLAPHHGESLDPGALWRSTIERPQDIDMTIAFAEETTRSNGFLDGMVDTGSLAIVGHSYGGYTALATAGARISPGEFEATCDRAYQVDDPLVFLCDALVPRLDEMTQLAGIAAADATLWPPLTDHEVDAVVSIAGDAAMFGASGLAEVTVPVMAIGGTADNDSPFDWGTRLTYDHVSSSRKVEIALEGAGHMLFAGGCESVRRVLSLAPLGFCSDPGWERDEAHELVKQLVAGFLVAELGGDPQVWVELDFIGQVPDVEHRSEGYETGARP